MRMPTTRLTEWLRNFAEARSGAVAIMYALLLVPLLGAIGCAVDYSRAVVVKMRLGEALDAAGLSVGGTVGLSDQELTDQAREFFYANYPDAELGTVTSLTVKAVSGSIVQVSGTARVETTFMALFGHTYMDVSATAEVTRESRGLEIALVLDNTGSMQSNGKIQALKTATTELIGILFGDQSNPSLLKMSLVPFSQTVKVNTTTFLNNGWMDTTGTSSSAKLNFDNGRYAFTVWPTMRNKSWGGCLEARPNGHEELDTVPDPSVPDSRWVPYFEPDGADNPPYNGYTTYITDGVAGTQDQRVRRSAKYINQNRTNPNNDCNMQQILPLTNDKATLLSYVGGMISTGYTHIAIGAGWGWRTLSPGAPYTEGASYDNADWQKAMVLLTDGLNTVDSDSTWHKSKYTAYNYLQRGILGTTDAATASAEQDARTLQVCERARAEGIRIYTILLEENAQRAKDLMRDCATDPSLYFESPSAGELKAVFQAVAQDLSNLRLSK